MHRCALGRVKFIYSEKVAKFCEIFTLLLTGTAQDKSKVEILQDFVALSEYMNFTRYLHFFILCRLYLHSLWSLDFCAVHMSVENQFHFIAFTTQYVESN